MPVFDFGDWPGVITAIPGFRILATMYYPDHEARRQELHATLVAAYGLRAAEEPAAMARPLAVADLLPISYARHAGRSVEGVRRAAQERLIQGSVAGDVLVWMRRMVAQVAALYLQGQSQYAIAQQVGVTQQQVSLDLKIIQKAWLASTLRDFDAAKSEQLAKIDAVELAAWGAWERSQLSRQVTLTKRVMGDFPREEESLRAESSAGEAKFLDVVLKCIQQRCDLLGLGAQAEAAKAVSTGLASLLSQAKSTHPVAVPLAEA